MSAERRLTRVLLKPRSFLFRKSCSLYKRRATKIITTLTSLFTSAYVMNWPHYFPNTPLKYPPSFDGRIVVYPNEPEIRDYFSWRQTDSMSHNPLLVILSINDFATTAHINNLYNTIFWALVQEGNQSTTQAHETLRVRIFSLFFTMLLISN